ncbi:type II secretion system protein [Paenibacillus qinlingensis]|uniref:type II secretion system protein n=1 Tax=Paenibacillus qinlingensis TaxID=1837343 RepID=UPI00156508B6|nr:prepilin-type N-terminal cleavage/methylation domain-containing protein [Paenibacillus qinlingensis]NQX63240.1 prepilin-type N-terminal cleavage/methylation domain-containing protein [Paenibacillus qinlingensis]
MLIKMMNRLKKEEKGFTLIELLAVIVILAVIAAIAVPYILGVIDKSKASADAATYHQIYEASRLYITAEKGDITADITVGLSTLVDGGYLPDGLVIPSTKAKITAGELKFSSVGKLTNFELTTKVGSATPVILKTPDDIALDTVISGTKN